MLLHRKGQSDLRGYTRKESTTPVAAKSGKSFLADGFTQVTFSSLHFLKIRGQATFANKASCVTPHICCDYELQTYPPPGNCHGVRLPV